MTSAYLTSPGVPSPSIVNGNTIRVTEYWPHEIACQIESIWKMVVVLFCFFFFLIDSFYSSLRINKWFLIEVQVPRVGRFYWQSSPNLLQDQENPSKALRSFKRYPRASVHCCCLNQWVSLGSNQHCRKWTEDWRCGYPPGFLVCLFLLGTYIFWF